MRYRTAGKTGGGWCSMTASSRKGQAPCGIMIERGTRKAVTTNLIRIVVLLLRRFRVPWRRRAPFPSRPIRILVTIPPGGAPDISARLLAHMQETLGWSVVIENRPGANGNIASEAVAKSAPDGYTLLLHADSGITINPHVYSKLSFDLSRTFCRSRASPPTSSCCRSIRSCRSRRSRSSSNTRNTKPPLPYASGGTAASTSSAWSCSSSGGYRPSACAVQRRRTGDHGHGRRGHEGAVLGVRECLADPRRPVARARDQREESLQALPDLPTIGEFYPGYAIDIWLGLFAPAGTPESIVTTLRTEIQKILARADFAEKLNVSGSSSP